MHLQTVSNGQVSYYFFIYRVTRVHIYYVILTVIVSTVNNRNIIIILRGWRTIQNLKIAVRVLFLLLFYYFIFRFTHVMSFFLRPTTENG